MYNVYFFFSFFFFFIVLTITFKKLYHHSIFKNNDLTKKKDHILIFRIIQLKLKLKYLNVINQNISTNIWVVVIIKLGNY